MRHLTPRARKRIDLHEDDRLSPPTYPRLGDHVLVDDRIEKMNVQVDGREPARTLRE